MSSPFQSQSTYRGVMTMMHGNRLDDEDHDDDELDHDDDVDDDGDDDYDDVDDGKKQLKK
jgi:hypothetical protein